MFVSVIKLNHKAADLALWFLYKENDAAVTWLGRDEPTENLDKSRVGLEIDKFNEYLWDQMWVKTKKAEFFIKQKPAIHCRMRVLSGKPSGIRTLDTLIKSQVL